MTREERKAQFAQKRRERFNQVIAMIEKNPETSIEQACKQIGFAYSEFYRAKKESQGAPKIKAAATSRKKRRHTKQLKVTTIEAAPMRSGMSFMFMGSPTQLAEFARSYEQA